MASKSANEFCLVFLFSNVSKGSLGSPRGYLEFILFVTVKAKKFIIQRNCSLYFLIDFRFSLCGFKEPLVDSRVIFLK